MFRFVLSRLSGKIYEGPTFEKANVVVQISDGKHNNGSRVEEGRSACTEKERGARAEGSLDRYIAGAKFRREVELVHIGCLLWP